MKTIILIVLFFNCAFAQLQKLEPIIVEATPTIIPFEARCYTKEQNMQIDQSLRDGIKNINNLNECKASKSKLKLDVKNLIDQKNKLISETEIIPEDPIKKNGIQKKHVLIGIGSALALGFVMGTAF